jgi:hypothetical protein
MRAILAGLIILGAASALIMTVMPQAFAQAACRQKCIDQEQACLKRTNNKGQCGRKAQACLAKCK